MAKNWPAWETRWQEPAVWKRSAWHSRQGAERGLVPEEHIGCASRPGVDQLRKRRCCVSAGSLEPAVPNLVIADLGCVLCFFRSHLPVQLPVAIRHLQGDPPACAPPIRNAVRGASSQPGSYSGSKPGVKRRRHTVCVCVFTCTQPSFLLANAPCKGLRQAGWQECRNRARTPGLGQGGQGGGRGCQESWGRELTGRLAGSSIKLHQLCCCCAQQNSRGRYWRGCCLHGAREVRIRANC